MGVGSKMARKVWLQGLVNDCRRQLAVRRLARLPKLRDNGATLGDVAEYLGRHGLLVRQAADDTVFVAPNLGSLGIKADD